MTGSRRSTASGIDLIELDGDDLRRDPLAVRKTTLASLLARAGPGLRFNEHMDEQNGLLVFQHACKLGLEGIVSKRRNSRYRSGRSPDWIKSKNPAAPGAGWQSHGAPFDPRSPAGGLVPRSEI
jgi:bifunctional non-homologous end joining protein LigD